MTRPQSITIAAICLIVASLTSFVSSIIVTVFSALIWFPAYTCMPLLAIWVLVVGILLLVNVRKGAGLAISGAVAALLSLFNCDLLTVALGATALYFLTRPESSAWLNNQPSDQPGVTAGAASPSLFATPEGATGVVIDASFFPLGFLLFLTPPRLQHQGVTHQLAWGKRFVPLDPGQHTLDMYTPYLGKHAPAKLDITIEPGQVAQLAYSAPIIMFMSGSLRLKVTREAK